jgi:transposase-like protein
MSITSKSLEATAVPDTEITLKPVRRTYTAAYKQAILQESERCAPGEIGAMLRREGLYSSLLSKWRSQRAQGELAGLEPQARGPRPAPHQAVMAQLRQENERLQLRLKQAEAIVEVQKKVSQLLGLMVISPDGAR